MDVLQDVALVSVHYEEYNSQSVGKSMLLDMLEQEHLDVTTYCIPFSDGFNPETLEGDDVYRPYGLEDYDRVLVEQRYIDRNSDQYHAENGGRLQHDDAEHLHTEHDVVLFAGGLTKACERKAYRHVETVGVRTDDAAKVGVIPELSFDNIEVLLTTVEEQDVEHVQSDDRVSESRIRLDALDTYFPNTYESVKISMTLRDDWQQYLKKDINL